jgi:hypothetical protein
MVGFTKKRVGTLTLGEKLKKLRSDKRFSLGEASRVTRIQVKYLEYLEEGNYDKLPADVYIKGFLRSYGDFLGVDGVVLTRIYEKERGIQKNLKKGNDTENGTRSGPKKINVSPFILTPKKIIFAIAILIFSGAIYYLYKEFQSFANAPRLTIISPLPNTDLDSNSVFVEGVTDKDAVLFINDQPVLINDEGKFRENITLRSGANAITVKAINKFKKETEESFTIRSNIVPENQKDSDNANNQDGVSEKDRENIADQKEIRIDLRVDPGPVWLSVEADGNLVFSGTMLSGSTQSFEATDKIVINSGRANATYLKFNGKDIGTLGPDSGAVRGVTFNKDIKY